MKLVKKICVALILIVLNVSFIEAKNYDEYNYMLLDSESMNESGIVSEFVFSDNKVFFICNGESYEFKLKEIEAESDMKCYSGKNGNLCCNLLQNGDNITVQVINKDIYPTERSITNDNFLVLVTKEEKQEVLETIKNDEQLKEIDEHNRKSFCNEGKTKERSNKAHVLASGKGLFNVISCGVSEGWAEFNSIEPGYYMVSKIIYNVAYNYSSDGTSLWYKRDANNHLFRTPVYCPAGVQSVSGSWKVKHGSSTLMAETTASISPKGIPIPKTIVDVYRF